jgi:hypothetical protein
MIEISLFLKKEVIFSGGYNVGHIVDSIYIEETQIQRAYNMP